MATDNNQTVNAAMAHRPELVRNERAHYALHGREAVGRLNRGVALLVTNSVGSMWCAYAFAALALISLPAAISSGSLLILIAWIAQTFLQLVLLPIIIVGQNVQALASDARAEADHATLTAIHTLTVDIHRINEQQSEILRRLDVNAGA